MSRQSTFTNMTSRSKTSDYLHTEKMDPEKPTDQRRAVLLEYRDYLLKNVDWSADDLFVTMEDANVITWDEHRAIKAQPTKMKPYRLMEYLASKESKEPFDTFCRILEDKGYDEASRRIRSALSAKLSLDNDIKQTAQKMVEEHFRCSTKSHPRQRELEQKMAEVLQTERSCWQEQVNHLQKKLDKLQSELYEICSRLSGAVRKTCGPSAVGKRARSAAGPLDQINAYTDAFVHIVKDLQDQNQQLSNEAAKMKGQTEEMQWQIHMLERVKHKQQEDLKKTRKDLHDCKKNISELNNEMRRQEEINSAEISQLVNALEDKGREIDALMSEKERLAEGLQVLGSKVESLEDVHDRFREDTDEKMQYLELKVQQLAMCMTQPAQQPTPRARQPPRHNCSSHGSHSSSRGSSSLAKASSPSDKSSSSLPPLKREGTRGAASPRKRTGKK